MTGTEVTHPFDSVRRFPDGDAGSRPVADWRDALGEDADGWTGREHDSIEGADGRTYPVVADSVGGRIVAVQVYDDAGEELAEWWDVDELEGVLEPMSGYVDEHTDRLREALTVVGESDDHVDTAEGPMMSYWYVLEDSSMFGGFDHDTLTTWAQQLEGLPLCAIEMDGSYGLALTGGGMDLSWEVAEAHLRLGYRPPSWIRLPDMADEGRDSRTGLDEHHAAIVRAVARTQRTVAMNALREVDVLIRRYGINLSAEALGL